MTDDAMTNDNGPGPGARRPDPLGILWRGLAAPQTLIALLLLVALALLLSSLVPHIPSAARGDPDAWLAVQGGSLGQSGSLFRVLRFYDLSHAFWFRLLLALAGLVLFVTMVDAAEWAWRCGREASEGGWEGFLRAVPGPPGELRRALPVDSAEQLIHDLLDRRGYRRLSQQRDGDEPDGRRLLAGRRVALLWARPAALGLALMALVGLAVAASLGWQSGDWIAAPGESRAVGHGMPYAVRLNGFDVGDPDGAQPGAAQAQVVWLEGDTVKGQGRASLGDPTWFRWLRVRLLGYVPDVTIRGWDEEGRPLVLQEEGENVGTAGAVEILFPSVEAQPLFFVPNQVLFLALSFQAPCGGGRPALRLTAFRDSGGTDQASATLYESGDLSLAGLRLAVTLAYRPILRLERHPGAGWALVAGALALLVLAAAWIFPPQVVEIAATPDGESGIVVRVAALAGAESRRWLRRFLQDLAEALADDV